MEENFICNICGSHNPSVFALTSTGKIPICNNDLGRFLCSQSGTPPIILPLAAIAFVESAADMHLYQERKEHMDKCDQLAELWSTAEREQYQDAVIKLQTLKQGAFAVVEKEFNEGLQKLRSLHESFEDRFATARSEIRAATSTKTLRFSPVADLIVSGVDPQSPVPAFFSGSVHDTSKQIEKAARSSLMLATQDADQFFQVIASKSAGKPTAEGPKPKPWSKEPKLKPAPKDREPTPTPNDPESKKRGRPPGKKPCQGCGSLLTDVNFASLEDHSTCLICFECIKTKNNIRLLCPECKLGYSKDSKKILEGKIPGLMTLLAANKKKKKQDRSGPKGFEPEQEVDPAQNFHQLIQSFRGKSKESTPPRCDGCSIVCEAQYHQCRQEVFCVECFEREIAENCYKKLLRCPTCKVLPDEILGNREAKKCSLCRKVLKLNEVAHWCDDSDFLVCGVCYPYVVKRGRCDECDEDLNSDSD